MSAAVAGVCFDFEISKWGLWGKGDISQRKPRPSAFISERERAEKENIQQDLSLGRNHDS